MADKRATNAVRSSGKHIQIDLDADVGTHPLTVAKKLRERLSETFLLHHNQLMAIESAYVVVQLRDLEPVGDFSGFTPTMVSIRSVLAEFGITDVRGLICCHKQAEHIFMRITIDWQEVEPKSVNVGGFYG